MSNRTPDGKFTKSPEPLEMSRIAPAPILVLPADTPAETVNDARKAGYLPVLCDDPSKIQILQGGRFALMTPDDLTMALFAGIKSMNSSAYRSEAASGFFDELQRRASAHEKGEKP